MNAIVFKAFDSARERAKNAGCGRIVRRRADSAQGHAGGLHRHADAQRVALRAGHAGRSRFHTGGALQAAGLIPLGKTNVPEFGILPTTESKLYGAAHNPWNLDRTPGGSSGGSAAAVAARIVPMAHATDGGGSIRIPSSCCGLVGLKVSRGRITQGPDMADSTSGLSVDNVVSRTVRDSAAASTFRAPPIAATRISPFRPMALTWRAFAKSRSVFALPSPSRRSTATASAPEVFRAVEKTAKLCEELGHTVEEASPQIDHDRMTLAFMTIWATSTASGVTSLARMTGTNRRRKSCEGMTFSLYEAGMKVTAAQQIDMLQVFHRAARVMAAFHENLRSMAHVRLWVKSRCG